MNSSKLGDKSCVVIIGIVASVLTLFSFLTGIFSIKDIFSSDNNSSQYSSPPTQHIVTEAPYEANVPIATTFPDSSESTLDENNLSITLLAGGAPLWGDNLGFLIPQANKDIAGNWTALREGGVLYYPDVNGVVSALLDPGEYALVFKDAEIYHASFGGSWGTVTGMKPNGYRQQMIIFSINSGEKTKIEIPLATLEVGLLSNSGEALKKKYVKVYCQGTDVSGKKTLAENATGCYSVYGHTDATGLIKFNLGAGTYVIYVSEDPPGSKDIQQDIYKFDVNLEPNEIKRIIINVP
ncbi:MAG: hypothetical protein ACOYYJ_22595 [Chloroflexota bacterium]